MKNSIRIWNPQTLNPWRELSSLQRRMDRLFDEMTRFESTAESAKTVDFAPACDFEETDSAYLIQLDVPGMTKDQLEVQISGNTLTVSGERKEEKKEGKGSNRRYECYHGRFERSFTLPDISEASKVEANCKDGVLSIAVPKSESAKGTTRRIQIGAGKSPILEKAATSPVQKKEQKAAEKAA